MHKIKTAARLAWIAFLAIFAFAFLYSFGYQLGTTF